MKESIHNIRANTREAIINIFKNKKSVKMNDDDLSYLHIFRRPSFGDGDSSKKDKKEYRDEDDEAIKLDYQTLKMNVQSKEDYSYPKNILNLTFFHWATRAIKYANSTNKLELSHLGKFHPSQYPSSFLEEIKGEWLEMSKKTKSSPLIKSLLIKNYGKLIFELIFSVIVAILDSSGVIVYEEIIKHLDPDTEEKPMFDLITSIVLLLVSNIIYTIFLEQWKLIQVFILIKSYHK